MKKVFTLACAVVAMMGVSTQTSSAAEKVLAGELDAAQQLTISNSIKAQAATIDAATQNRADDEEEWVKVSTGIWFEGPLAARFSDIDADQWDVDIYECATKPGYIRLNPYYEGTQPANILGKANTVDLEINIADPNKCYFLDWAAFGSSSFSFGSYVPENDWTSGDGYGTLVDGTLTFPAGTVAYYNSGWKLLNGEIKIVLDKEAYVDYTLEFEVPFCSTEAENYVKITKSDAIATVKAVFLEGEYPMNDNNAKVVNAQGSDVTRFAGQVVASGLEGPNTMWSILYVGLDADGNIQAQGVVNTYIVEDDADNWKAIGDAVYTEGLISEFFTDIDSEELACTIEENVNTPGYYRLVNPYKNYQFAAKDGHNHYLYIDATDPEKVVVEPSALGVYINSNFGYAAAQSWGYYLGEGTQADTYKVWGTIGNGEITVPAFRLQLSSYGNGGYLNITSLSTTTAPTNPFKVVITPAAPTHDIEGVDENGAVEMKDGEEIVLTAEGHDIYFAWEDVKAEEDPQALTQQRMPADDDFVILPAEAEGKLVFEAENDGDQKYLHFYAKNAYHGGKSPITSVLVTRKGTTDGVENINASNNDAVEYFNLQGIRIDNPANGQVVIRRQGSEVVKIVK